MNLAKNFQTKAMKTCLSVYAVTERNPPYKSNEKKKKKRGKTAHAHAKCRPKRDLDSGYSRERVEKTKYLY